MMNQAPARALISRRAFEQNIDVLRQHTDAKLMAIVKANGYGHGVELIAQWAWEAGIDWLGLAQLNEALALRQTHTHGHILAWIYAPGANFQRAIEQNIDLSVGSQWAIDEISAAARASGRAARIHIKVDTGMTRGGFDLGDLPDVFEQVKALARDGIVEVVGLWSHLSCADDRNGDAVTDQQVARFEQARAYARQAGVDIELCHLAASAGILWHRKTHYDMVRPGIVLYGLSPNPARASGHDLGLEALMTLEADVILTRDVPPGVGVSYGHTFVTDHHTRLAVVPVGYADGILRHASDKLSVTANDQQAPIRGVVCMDQFVIEAPQAQAGDTIVLFGPANNGYLTADDWAQKTDTINYEIFCHLGPRIARIPVE
ncbi:alanine racemase [Arcanobacterium pinnipediorum]|uniref:Alanine racemase n=1 Tax=Arcanobacterium pinnipediorum TaxID=1503041 RepID=A0ABY5AIN5_9ACTO|nr:alanine racemase [Arcanobacterium pinnipediorum]USR79058.1 alanine racemase [Arcanobacterium pinnipediorum]